MTDIRLASAETLRAMLASPTIGEPAKVRIRELLAARGETNRAIPGTIGPAGETDRSFADTLGANEHPATLRDSIHLVLFGPPRTKKTHNQIVWRGGRQKVLPSAAWMAWRTALAATGQLPVDGTPLPERPWQCRAVFYRDRDAGDLVGFQQGLADVLEEHGVITNDRWITSWDGTRLDVDRACPRVELWISPMADEPAAQSERRSEL